MRKSSWIFPFFLLLALSACKKDTEEVNEPKPEPTPTGVNLVLSAFPFNELSTYRFFTGELKSQTPNDGVLYYDPISHLFTDYALKNRYIWMPPGTSASYVNDHDVFDFPVGTAIIKNFYYDNVKPDNTRKIIETRLMVNTVNGWEFAEYVWNDEQTEATLDLSGSNVFIEWTDSEGVDREAMYRVPAEAECHTCHKDYEVSSPIGPKPQNLNKEVDYSGTILNQLEKWVLEGYLQPDYPADISTVVNYEDAMQPLTDRVRSYVDINCAHCHRTGGHCDYRPIRFGFDETVDLENLGVCVVPDEEVLPQHTRIVEPQNIERSVLHYRINTTEVNYRMPLLGRTIVHEEGVALLEEWINSLDIECEN